MSTENRAEQNDTVDAKAADEIKGAKRAWITPALTRMRAGEAETGPGDAGETNSLS